MEHRLKVYLDQAIALAQSIVFKHDLAGVYVNRELMTYGHTISTDKATWRYYLNLAGQYHFSNVKMSIFSADTLTTVDYTRESIAEHQATRELLSYDSPELRTLLDTYPQQQTLVRSIPHAISVNTIIDMEDGDIVYFDKRLVEPNELSLIQEVSNWIKFYLRKWIIPSFIDTDEFYYPAMLGVLYSKLPGVILNHRLKMCRTSEVHSFHVIESLRTYRRLDQFHNFFTLDQSLWLYRNLNWLRANVGQQRSFDALVSNILTRRGMELKRLKVASDLKDVPTAKLKSSTVLPVQNINFQASQAEIPNKDIDDLILEQVPVAKGNYEYREEMRDKLNAKMPYVNKQELGTKTYYIESNEVTGENGITLDESLVEHWISLASRGLYNGFEDFTNPTTGEVVTLTPLEGFYLYTYCFYGALGIEIDKVPEIHATHCRKTNIPSLESLLSITTPEITPTRLTEYVWSVHRRHESIPAVNNTTQFWSLVNDMFDDFNLASWPYKASHDYYRRAELKNVWKSFYFNHRVTDYSGEDYSSWLTARGVRVDNFNEIDYRLFAMEILRRFTGAGDNNESGASSLLDAMAMVMRRLTNYSVQFITALTSTDNFNLEWSAFRARMKSSKGIGGGVASVNIRPMPIKTKSVMGDRAKVDVKTLEISHIPIIRLLATSSVTASKSKVIGTTNHVQSSGLRAKGETKDV